MLIKYCSWLQAMCCSDQIHCCPHGYICDVSSQTCKQGNLQISWLRHIPSFSATKHKLDKAMTRIIVHNVVQCADNTTECPDGYTCCMSDKGHMECCPHPSVSLY